jgi:hypothetical protein
MSERIERPGRSEGHQGMPEWYSMGERTVRSEAYGQMPKVRTR